MISDQYKIVFDGELMPGMTTETVRENMARLFRTAPERLEKLFAGSPVAVKRSLTEAEADRYIQALATAGAKARKEPEAVTLALTIEPQETDIKPEATNELSCPKCGHRQTGTVQCNGCGIVFEKYRARLAREEAIRAGEGAGALKQFYAPPSADVAGASPEQGALRVFSFNGRIGRLRYLAWSLGLTAAACGCALIAALGFALSEVFGGLLLLLVALAYLVVSFQIGAQRLHDFGWSGWFLFLCFVPFVGSLFPLALLLVPGTQGANRFGPPQPPNSTAVKVLAALWLLVPVIGILAAIALPAYMQSLGLGQADL
ncbi:DUF805 domain-containing protein [Stutzerimonas stutzeri]